MLQLEPVYTSDCFTIEADPRRGIVRMEWLQPPVNDHVLMDGGIKLNQFISESDITKVLSNSQQIGALSPKAKDWLSTTYYDDLSKAGIQKLARVLPANLFSKLALESVVTRAEAMGCIDFLVKNFADEKAAAEWLLAAP